MINLSECLAVELEGKKTAEETTEAILKRKEISEQILKLENQIGDRSKLTVEQLAARGDEILGRGMPHGLERIHAITPAIASARHIRDLHLDAEEAAARGDIEGATRLQAQSDKLRTTNFALKSTEREPNREVEFKLEQIHEALTRSGIIVDQIKTQNR